jgi:hypothetical protein
VPSKPSLCTLVCYVVKNTIAALLRVQQYQLFDFGARSSPIVLILDRRDDPVTPLLTQWTYQAMIHELIGIKDSTAKLTSAKVSRGAMPLRVTCR